MNIDVKINDAAVVGKVESDQMGLLVSQEWKRLIDPYTPRDTGQLMGLFGGVDIEPFKLHYTSPYAAAVYYNTRGAEFKTGGSGRNPYATDHWDEAAANAGQLNKLYQAVNARLKRE